MKTKEVFRMSSRRLHQDEYLLGGSLKPSIANWVVRYVSYNLVSEIPMMPKDFFSRRFKSSNFFLIELKLMQDKIIFLR